MDTRRTCEAVLLAASGIMGSEDALARELKVSTGTLIRWMVGDEAPKLDAFLAAVDVILAHNEALTAEAARLVARNQELRARARRKAANPG